MNHCTAQHVFFTGQALMSSQVLVVIFLFAASHFPKEREWETEERVDIPRLKGFASVIVVECGVGGHLDPI